MNVIGFIHLPEINIFDKSLKIDDGEIIRLPAEEWATMDQYYERFQTQIKRNGEPVFFKYASFDNLNPDQIQKNLSVIRKRLHLSLILYSGVVTILPDLSITYILYRNNLLKSEIGDSLQRIVGESGREFIVNNYERIILSKIEENDINYIYNYLKSCHSNLNSSLITNITSTITTMGFIGMSTLSKITYLVISIENLILPEIKSNIRENFVRNIQRLIVDIFPYQPNLETILKAIYDIRSAVVHGQETDKILRKIQTDGETLLDFTLKTYFIILLKILYILPTNATNIEIDNCISNLTNNDIKFPKLNLKWLKNG